MATFQLDRQTAQEARDFLQEYLRENHPEGDFRPGTALHDLVVKSYSILFAFLKREIETTRELQSITEILNIPEDSPLFQDDISTALDALMSNWFLTRRSGNSVTGTVGVRFTAREASLTIRKGHQFFLGGDVAKVYLSSSDQVFRHDPASNLSDYREVAASGTTLHEISVSVESNGTGSEFLSTGTTSALFTFDPINAFAVNAVQIGDFLGGADTESDVEFVDRAKEAITKRDLSTFKSIPTLLRDEFSVIEAVEVVGYGDPEMQRDRIEEILLDRVVEPAGIINIENTITAAMKLYLKLDEFAGRQYTRDSTETFDFDQIKLYEGVGHVHGYTDVDDHWTDGQVRGGISISPNQSIEVSWDDQEEKFQPFLNNVTGNFTLMFWVKGRPKAGNAVANIFHTTGIGGISNSTITVQATEDGYINFKFKTTFPEQTTTSSINSDQEVFAIKARTDDGFSFVVCTFLGDAMNLYIDGVLQDSVKNTGIPTGFGDVIIGGSSDPDDALTFDGILDNLVFYNQGMNDLQIKSIYNRQESGAPNQVGVDQEQLEANENRLGLAFDEYFHVGGRVDIYGKTPVHVYKAVSEPIIETVDSSANHQTIKWIMPNEPIYRIYYKGGEERVPLYEFLTTETSGEIILDEDAGTVLSFDYYIDDPLLFLSDRQVAYLTLSINVPHTETALNDGFIKSSFEYDTVTSFDAIESYVENRQNRIVCGDLLIKAPIPIYVSTSIQYSLEVGVVSIDETAVKSTISEFIQSIKPGEILEGSDLISILYSQFGVGRIKLPITLTGRILLPDGRSFEFESLDNLPVPVISDYVDIHPVLEKIITQRTVRYIAPKEDIIVSQL